MLKEAESRDAAGGEGGRPHDADTLKSSPAGREEPDCTVHHCALAVTPAMAGQSKCR